MHWNDRVAVVTGASRGIGQVGCARRGGRGGAASDSSLARQSDLDKVLAEIGGRGAAAAADAAEPAATDGGH